MELTKDLNLLSENEFMSKFGTIFEKSEWIASETFKQKPFENYQDLINKMINIYNACSNEKIIKIFNLHPRLAIEKKLTSFSLKEQSDAELNSCKSKNEILENFRIRIKNEYSVEFSEAKTQVRKIATLRLNKILNTSL